MKQSVILMFTLVASACIFVACQRSEPVIVTREIITNVMVHVTATPEPTEEPSYLGGGGQYIAFTVESVNGHSGVFLLDQISKEQQILSTIKFSNIPQKSPGSPKWSPDGTKIAFMVRDEHESKIHLIDLESNEITRLPEDSLIVAGFDWSPSGSEIAFLGTEPEEIDGSLYLIEIDGSSQEEIATRDNFIVLYNSPVDWSTKDEVLVSAFVLPDEGLPPRNEQIFQINLVDGNLRRVSDERFDYFWADLSPDASHVIFFSPDEEGGLDLFLMNADGNKLQLLTDLSIADPAWSPDSRQIAYAYNGSISIMDVRDGTAVAVATMYDTRAPSWSPDGEWIVFAGKSKETSYFQLYMVRADGTELTLLTNTEQHHDLPVWQP